MLGPPGGRRSGPLGALSVAKTRGRVLVLDSDDGIHHVLDVLFARTLVVEHAHDVPAARALTLDREPARLSPMIVDPVAVPNTLDLIREIRLLDMGTACVAFVGALDGPACNQLAELRVPIVSKNDDARRIARLLLHHVADRDASSRLGVLLTAYSERWGLSGADYEVLHLAAIGKQRREIAEALKISPNSVKDRVKRILRKTGVRNLDEIYRQMLTRA